MQRYSANRLRIQQCMMVHCTDHYSACFIRYFAIQLINWLQNIDMSSVMIAPPNFCDLFYRMDVDDPS
jgi:hypothetical protein